MKPASRLWLSLESIPGSQAIQAEWQHRLAAEFDTSQPLLRPTTETADCFSLPNWPMPVDVVRHGVDDFVGVPRGGAATVTLHRKDVLVYRFDHELLAQKLGNLFHFTVGVSDLHDAPMTWRIGSLIARAAVTPVHLTFPLEPADLLRAIEAISASNRQPYLVMAPTRRRLSPRAESLLQITNGHFFALCDAVSSRSDGTWEPDPDTLRSLNRLGGMMVNDEPLSERAQAMLVAMLELNALDADRRRATSAITAKALGPGLDGNSLKPVIAELTTRGLTETRQGRGGGCWLTDNGRLRAEKLKMAASQTV